MTRGPQPNAALLRECRAAFDWWERFASSRAGTLVMFGWALAEAVVWPLIPDVLLVPMAAANRRRFYVPLAAAILGSALGGAALYLFAFWWPEWALDFLEIMPLVGDRQIETARERLATDGVSAFLGQPWSGIPFKVWGVLAGVQGLDPWRTIPAFILARALRMAVFATLARVLAGLGYTFLRDFFLYIVVIYLALFFYGWWQVVG